LASTSADLGRISAAALFAVCVVSLALVDGSFAQLPLPPPQPPPPQPSPDAPSSPSSKVRVASTGVSPEIPKTLPIARHPGKKRVVISLRPQGLPELQPGDQLEVTAEVEVTTDCLRRREVGAECHGEPYRFNPHVRAALILAGTGGATTGLSLVEPQEIVCRQKLPARQHHCYLALSAPPFVVSDQSPPPCAPGFCRVQLVMDAFHRRARPGNVLLVGGNTRNGKIRQGKGSIDAIRTRPPDPSQVPPPLPTGTATTLSTEPLITGLSLANPPRRAVVYSQQLDALRDGEQLAARAGVLTGIRRLRHNAKISSRLILADSPLATNTGPMSAEVGMENGEITEGNGFNCTQRTTPCVTLKSGVLEIERDAPGPLYVNLVLSISRVGGRSPGDNLVTIREGGGLNVVRYPAEHKG
jgi:hypothetical protein